MQPTPYRSAECERLVNAAHRLAKISQNNPVKLFRLLYLLDIKFFQEAGRSCTGETYYAMADGPAPGTLRSLLVMPDVGLDVGIGILTSTPAQGPWPFDPKPFCPSSLGILHKLETTHSKTAMRDLSLCDGNAWWRVYNRCRGVGAAIPYEMTLQRGDYPAKVEPALWQQTGLAKQSRRADGMRMGEAGMP